MTRYELSDGTANKFWELALDGNHLTTTYGRIGSAGQRTTKSFASTEEAEAAADKLIAEKTRKGYVPAGGRGAAGGAAARPAKNTSVAAADATASTQTPGSTES